MKRCDWWFGKFIKNNFSELTDSNHIFRNGLVSIHYHLCKIPSLFIECVIFAPYDLLQWTLLITTISTLWFYVVPNYFLFKHDAAHLGTELSLTMFLNNNLEFVDGIGRNFINVWHFCRVLTATETQYHYPSFTSLVII